MTVTSLETANGTLGWAVRGSLLHYITVISRGSSEMQGGVTLTEGGVFVFPLKSVSREGDQWRFAFDGSLRFTAHQGFLDINIVSPTLVIGPTGGVLTTQTAEENPATIQLASVGTAEPDQDGRELVWKGLSAQLLEEGVGLFGDVYETGAELSPLEIRVSLN